MAIYSPDRDALIQHLFDEVVDLDGEERTAHLDQACADDPHLRREVEALLQAQAHTADLFGPLDQPIATPAAVGPDLQPGHSLSHYWIKEKLGGGGMGVVYKAHDTRLGRTVALKFLPPHLSLDEDAKRRFIHEAKAASALDHPHICTIYDIDETEHGQLFIAMAYYAGETLKKKIARGPLPVEEALDYAIQVAQGLAKAHEAGIVHRDVKPANVMITEDKLAKVVDFGLAKMADVSLTQTGTTLGTVAYMSPEQARGQEVDHRTDLWSLGVILYEMLTGKQPFHGAYAQAVIYSILNEEPEPMTVLRTEVPEALVPLVKKLLRKDPASRYQGATELLADLRALRPRQAMPAQPLTRSERWRRPILWAVVAVLVVVGLGYLLVGQRSTPEAASTVAPPDWWVSVAVPPLENLSKDPAQEDFADGMTVELITTLTKIEGLRTVAPRSMMNFKGTELPPSEIAQQLEVDYIVDASMYQAEGQVRITVNLVDGKTNTSLWGQSFERRMQDVLALQSEIARAIAREVEVILTPQDEARLAEAPAVNTEAYELYLLGLEWRWRDAFGRAAEYFEESVALDSSFVPAFVALATVYTLKAALWGDGASVPRARHAVEKALELDPDVSEAYMVIGLLRHLVDWDLIGAEEAFRRALALKPDQWEARREYGLFLHKMGRQEEALKELQQVSPRPYFNLAWVYGAMGEYDQAIENFKKALELYPNYAFLYLWLAWAYRQKDMHAEEAAMLERAIELAGGDHPYDLWTVGLANAELGQKEEALQAIDQLKEIELFYWIAAIYAALGEQEQALDWLEQAYEQKRSTGWLAGLKVSRRWNSLRSEPRFQALLKKMGLE